MKRVIVTAAFILAAFIGQAQTKPNAEKTKDGNYVAITSNSTGGSFKKTGKTYTAKDGKIYDVLISDKGKLFIIRTSKNTGKEYRYYLTVQN